ncbi:hypothetical protein [Sulfurimonas sp. HSL-1716]|uniref:hypothetical protein n=1 Tax=Hydrocurvibacter sulfurireducens TaxID=3131937 RepID=UPI0031F7C004
MDATTYTFIAWTIGIVLMAGVAIRYIMKSDKDSYIESDDYVLRDFMTKRKR